MLTEKPEHMTEEEWTAFNDDEMGEAPKAKYDNADVKLDDEVEALLATEQPKAMMLPLLTQFRLLSLKNNLTK